ncbi:hypothetical protein OSTOST_00828 [Ostertagia ostertagi]
MQFIQDCGLFEATSLLVVADPCDDVGSAGSALNALLNAVEQLCAQRGLSVLNEQLLEKSKILILLIGASKKAMPLGAGFLSSLKVTEFPWIMPDCPVAHAIHNVNELAKNCEQGVWICGKDNLGGLNSKIFVGQGLQRTLIPFILCEATIFFAVVSNPVRHAH